MHSCAWFWQWLTKLTKHIQCNGKSISCLPNPEHTTALFWHVFCYFVQYLYNHLLFVLKETNVNNFWQHWNFREKNDLRFRKQSGTRNFFTFILFMLHSYRCSVVLFKNDNSNYNTWVLARCKQIKNSKSQIKLNMSNETEQSFKNLTSKDYGIPKQHQLAVSIR